MIYYLCPDHPKPSGGVKTLYRHVDVLNSLGYEARILHTQPGFRCTWFGNVTPISYTKELHEGDVLVLPEIHGPETAWIARGVPKVIFNQNSHYTFRYYDVPPPVDCLTPYLDPEVKGTMVLTDYCAEVLHWAFPKHPIYVTPHGIDPVTFPLGTNKRKQIAYMPRKHADEAQQVFGWLRFRDALDGWDVVAIDGLSEAETSRVLQESMVYFAFGYPEGGTLPPFEAAACGCVPVGYGGFSSDGLLVRCGGELVRSANTTDFAHAAEVVLLWPWDSLVEWGRDCSRRTLDVLSMEKERTALAAAWSKLL